MCELPAISKFFNGNPGLGQLGGGVDAFAGRTGRKRWAEIELAIGRSWDNVVDAIDESSAPPTSTRPHRRRQPTNWPKTRRKSKRRRSPRKSKRPMTAAATDDADVEEAEELEDHADGCGARQRRRLLGQGRHRPGADHDHRRVPTTRCGATSTICRSSWGRNGRISVFGSERALARYLADEHDHDISNLATYDDIRTAANDGSLRVNVSDENVYVLTEIVDYLAEGPRCHRPRPARSGRRIAKGRRRGLTEDFGRRGFAGRRSAAGQDRVGYVLESRQSPANRLPPYAKAVEQWEALETFVESRLREE